MTKTERTLDGAARFTVTGVMGLAGVTVAGLLFALLLASVEAQWPPLEVADAAVVAAAHDAVSGSPWAVSALGLLTNLGGWEAAWLLLTITVLWLLLRRSGRLAAYVAATGLGAAVLSPGVKALVDRARPDVDVVLIAAPGPSFPSGHSLGSTVTYGVLVLVFLPVVPPAWRRPFVLAAAALVVAIGATRVALAVHYPSDVLGGWLLGVLWLAITASAFRRWREAEGLRRRPLTQGLLPEERGALVPAPRHGRALPEGWHSVSELLVAAVLLWGAVVGIGLVVTEVAPLERFDVAVIEWFVRVRSAALDAVAVAVGRLGGTAGIVIALVAATTVALAITRRWRPPLFLVVATVGETALFLGAATIVDRARPPVDHLTASLPPTSSFPSGHVAATVATYGAVALLVGAWSRSRLRHVAVVLAVLAASGVALSRLYRGVHHPTDVLISVLYASVWIAVCWKVLRPGPGRADERDETERTPAADAPPDGPV